VSGDLFREFFDEAKTTGERKLTLQELIAWQVKHDAKRQAQEQYERDAKQNKAKVTP
jgi:hypothetical protein